jgi:tetratricopeptide (TPR) repeat protein
MVRALVCLLLALAPRVARAGDTPEQIEAAQRAAEGRRLLEDGRFSEALGALRIAYRGDNDATLLFDMGECQRRLGRCKEAIYSYERYLAQAQPPTRRAEAEASIATCKVEVERFEREHPPVAAPPPKPFELPEPRRRAPFVDVAKVPRVMRHWWFWTAVGAVAAAALAIGLGVAYGGEKEPAHPGDTAGSIKVVF